MTIGRRGFCKGVGGDGAGGGKSEEGTGMALAEASRRQEAFLMTKLDGRQMFDGTARNPKWLEKAEL